MSVSKYKLVAYPGFGVQIESTTNPFFVSMVFEDLKRIESKPIGKKLLADIAAARPRARSASAASSAEAKAIEFFDGVNVVIVPTTMTYNQSGFKMGYGSGSSMERTLQPSATAAHNVKGCPYYPVGGSSAQAADIMAAGDGTGSVSIMKYTNAQIMTSKGEATASFIVLAHELIHSLHHVTGTRRDDVEEQWTTGLGIYADEAMTENAIRKAFGVKLREAY
jgi:hypothetical protein